MADTKISALTASTTPLAGTEVLPIVQSGTTKQVSVANLTAGRVISANGVAFPATASASSDPNTLDDYEEGTWTPTPTGGTFGVTYASGFYTKVGRQVTATCFLAWNSLSGSGNFSISLPFTINNTNYYRGAISLGNSSTLILLAGYAIVGTLDQGATQTDFYFLQTNLSSQRMTVASLGSSGNITFTATYMV